MSSSGERPGRPANSDGNNRERILAAARTQFATHGFQGATMRAIADAAGFDVALVAHYFRNKDNLFAYAMELPLEATQTLSKALTGPPEQHGARLARAYLTLWEDPETGPQMQATVRSALTNQAALERIQGLLADVASQGDPGDKPGRSPLNIALAMGSLLGIAVLRYITHVGPVADLELDALVALIAPGIQAHLDSVD